MTLAEFRSRLSGVTKAGDGWLARCPAHEDRRQSLSIGAGEAGKILVRCHAGCSAQSIVGAVGLKLSDLFSDSATTSGKQISATYDYKDERGDPTSTPHPDVAARPKPSRVASP